MSQELCYYSTDFDFKICVWAQNVSETFEKRAPGHEYKRSTEDPGDEVAPMFGTMCIAAYSLYVLSLLIKIVISNSALNFLQFFSSFSGRYFTTTVLQSKVPKVSIN